MRKEFTLLLVLYDTDFTSTQQYEQLLINFLADVITKDVWLYLSCRSATSQAYEGIFLN